MLYILGYILACLVIVAGLAASLGALHLSSNFKPLLRQNQKPPLIKSHAVITFSIVLPFSALAFLILTFAALKIAPTQGLQGHLAFVAGSLIFPTFCFLTGYFYFKKAVGS